MADNGNPAENTEIRIGAKVNEIVHCSQCQKEVTAEQYYTYKDDKGEAVFLCDGCRAIAAAAAQQETEHPNMVGAFFAGMAAAVVAGIAWYAISVLTGYQIGYVAIGVGFIIGHAIIWGAGRKRGSSLQIMSAIVTLFALFTSEYFMALYHIRRYLLEHVSEFPGYQGQWIFLSPFNPDVLSNIFSPMGLLIWAIGIYFAYSVPKPRSV